MDHGAWRWCCTCTCTSSPLNTSQRGYAETREHQLRHAELTTVIRQVLALSKPETGSYGQLAWPWFLTSPLLRQRVHGQCMYSIVLLYVKICPADCSGWKLLYLRLPSQDLDVRCDVSVAPGGVLYLMSNSLVLIVLLATLRGHWAWDWPKFSSPPESPMDGLPTFRLSYVPAYLRSGLPIHQLLNLPGFLSSTLSSSSSITSSSGTSIFLFYVIGLFFVYKIIFLFLSSKYAVEACDTNTYCWHSAFF